MQFFSVRASFARKNCITYLRFARDPARLDQPLPNTLLPFPLWTPVVLKAFDEIVHRFAARETRLYVEQRDDDTTERKNDDLKRQPEDLHRELEGRVFDFRTHVHRLILVRREPRRAAERPVKSAIVRRGLCLAVVILRRCLVGGLRN